jgi:hypothetical protein
VGLRHLLSSTQQAALERVQRLEAMLGPVREALIGACEKDGELKKLLLKRVGSKAEAVSRFVDREQTLDELLQVGLWNPDFFFGCRYVAVVASRRAAVSEECLEGTDDM